MSSPDVSQQDQAWVTVETPLSREQLTEFCRDLERLFRINPLLEFREWQRRDRDRYRLLGTNLGNGQPLDLELSVAVNDGGFEIRYAEGIKRATRLTIEGDGQGARLTILDDYSGLDEAERTARLSEVDQTLVPWGKALHSYLRHWHRWSWCPPWRWYMRRVWQPMKPSARRITMMLLMITGLEFFAFLMVFLIFWLELDKYAQL